MEKSSNQKFKHNNQKKKGHFRKQKHPQKRKTTFSADSNHLFCRNATTIKNIQAQARDLANTIRKRRLVNLPNIILQKSTIRGVSEQEKEKMKIAMVRRYNFDTKALDLTNFGNNDDLIDFKCELFRQPYLCAAVDIIVNYIPDLEALNLNENNLNIISRLGNFTNKLPNLRILYLARNKITMHSSLGILKDLPIVELSLEGNPFIEDFKDNDEYVTEIRKTFPKLLKLDGKNLDPLINFDLVDEKKALPSWKKLFLCNPSGQEIVTKFIQQYFTIYDSDNRQLLLDAYHENAIFSITATTNQNLTQREILTSYHRVSRNFLRKGTMTPENRYSSLKRGKVSVVALLSELPPTKHDPQSFAVDLTFFTQQMIVLTITGIFKERNADPKAEYVRVFQKILIIVPNSLGGLCVRNEMLHINNATLTQSKKAFKTLIIPKPLPITISCEEIQNEENVKTKMIQALSKQTNMNLEWSKKCLEETNYDYDRACFVFNELYKINKIPQEAFSMLE